MSKYACLNPILIEKALKAGYTDLQSVNCTLYGYAHHQDVIPQPFDLDTELSNICERAGNASGVSGNYVASHLANVISSFDHELQKQLLESHYGLLLTIKTNYKSNKKSKFNRWKANRSYVGFLIYRE